MHLRINFEIEHNISNSLNCLCILEFCILYNDKLRSIDEYLCNNLIKNVS